MMTGRRAADWLAGPSSSGSDDEDRRWTDRRGGDRRAPRRKLDLLFAASLVNQIAPSEENVTPRYQLAPIQVRRGLVVNFRV